MAQQEFCSDGLAVVMDNGSETLKTGFAGDDAPRHVLDFPSAIGKAKLEGVTAVMAKHAVARGLEPNWDATEKIWRHAFEKALRVKPSEHSVLLTEVPLNAKENREKATQTMFETFEVPEFFLANRANLSLFSVGRTTGIVCLTGAALTHAAPVYEGYCLPHAVVRLEVAGDSVTEYLSRLLTEVGFYSTSTSDVALIRDIKEKLCYVALEYEKELAKAEVGGDDIEKNYELPDGTVLTLTDQRMRATEVLFQPMMIGSEQPGFPRAIYESIRKCDVDIRRDMYNNLVMSGGNSMFEGMTARMQQEVRRLAPDSFTVKVIAPPERKYSAFIGGSILSSLSTFEEMWITKSEYDESGPSIVHRKCQM